MAKSKLAKIPDEIDPTEDWLCTYWAGEFGVSTGAVIDAVGKVGASAGKVRKHFKDGIRISIRDDDGTNRLVTRLSFLNDGFALMVPYHPAESGWLYRKKVRYDKEVYEIPASEIQHYRADSRVKLSLHMTGFVQFSSSAGKTIISG